MHDDEPCDINLLPLITSCVSIMNVMKIESNFFVIKKIPMNDFNSI